MGKLLSHDEKRIIIEEKLKGTGSRKIGDMINRGKSTVNDYWNRIKEDKQEVKRSAPKITLFDLETAPEIYMGFGRYKQNIAEDFVLQEPYMLSFVAKELGADTAISLGLPYYKDTYEPMKPCDEQLVRDLHNILDSSDILIAHNLKGFDMKVANTRFLRYGLDPISPVKLIDTLDIARSNFKFPTNKLDTIARYLGVGKKLSHTGASMWRDCVEGNEDAWRKMIEYNVVDVEVLEEVYLKLRPFDKRHPNLALYYPATEHRCVKCGSTDLELTDKKAYTSLSEFNVYKCNGCGTHIRNRQNNLSKAKRENILMNVQ